MRHCSHWIALILCIVSTRLAYAQVPKPVEYVLGPMDVITLTVGSHDDLDQTVSINEDGKVLLKGIGEMKAAGLTVAGLRMELQTELDKTLNNDPVTVTLKERHAESVKINGAVIHAGQFDLKPGMRLLDLLALSGTSAVNSRLISGQMIRGGRQFKIDITQAYANPLTDDNPILQANDMVILTEIAPPARLEIAVEGQVLRPGMVEITDQTTTIGLLQSCGGPTAQAALLRTYILRDDKQIPLNLQPLLILGKPDDAVVHFKYHTGDELFIPTLDTKFTVMGSVGHPGTYYIPETGIPVTVFDSINEAGEITQDSTASKSKIYRKTGDKITTIDVNLDKIMKHGDVKNNIVMQPGDTLFVPPHKKSPFPSIYDVFAPLSLLALLGFHI